MVTTWKTITAIALHLVNLFRFSLILLQQFCDGNVDVNMSMRTLDAKYVHTGVSVHFYV